MHVSHDEALKNVPQWRTFVNVDEFVQTHSTWSFYNIEQRFSTKQKNLEKWQETVQKQISEQVDFQQILEPFLTQYAPEMIHLGMHVHSMGADLKDLVFLHLLAVPGGHKWEPENREHYVQKIPVKGIENTYSDFLFNTQNQPNVFALADVNPRAQQYRCYREHVEHFWLHEALKATTDSQMRHDMRILCPTADPVHVGEHLQTREFSDFFIKNATTRLKKPSRELSKEENNFRLIGATLIETVDPQELYDATNAIVGV